MDRQKDGQTLFYGTLPAKAGGPICCDITNKKMTKLNSKMDKNIRLVLFELLHNVILFEIVLLF